MLPIVMIAWYDSIHAIYSSTRIARGNRIMQPIIMRVSRQETRCARKWRGNPPVGIRAASGCERTGVSVKGGV